MVDSTDNTMTTDARKVLWVKFSIECGEKCEGRKGIVEKGRREACNEYGGWSECNGIVRENQTWQAIDGKWENGMVKKKSAR